MKTRHWSLLLLVIPTMLWAQDSTPGAELLTGVGMLTGVLAVLLTGLAKKAAEFIDMHVTSLDGKLTTWYKPFQPVIALVLAYALPLIPFLSGLTPDGVAAAPVGVISAMALRELLLKLKARFLPANS